MSGEYVTCEFRVDGRVEESVSVSSVPRIGESVEVGAMFLDGERIDPSDNDAWHDFDANYETVLSGVVTGVTRHYASAPRRNELTAYIDIDPDEQ